MTEIASAGLSVPLGDFSFVLPSAVLPSRSSRKMVTTRRISSIAGASAGSSNARPKLATRVWTISTSSSAVSGTGKITVLKRRLSALDNSFTPRSRLFAVAITLNPFVACTSSFNSGIGKVFSDKIVINVSCTSAGMRVSSSTRASLPSCIARIIGLATKASREGPLASKIA